MSAAPAAEPVAEPASLSAKPAAAARPAAEPAKPAAVQPEAKPAEPAPAAPVQTAQESCPGNPNALGTSRVITVTPEEFSRIGTLQYKQTLPLNDHEVVLTFDDGPIPPYSNIILDTLDSQCVKATYFMVGEMAHAYPSIVRRIYNAGHTIGTHSQHHPFAFQRLSMQRVEREVDGGIASVDAALGDPKAVAPFFRIPGFGRTNAIEQFLAAKKLVTWSTDVDTNDWWRGTTPGQIVQRAMRRLDAKGRGIILMHDIHPATAMALPTLLKELKSHGYHVVQVVSAGPRPTLAPELIASPDKGKGAWPRPLKASIASTGDEPAPRHRFRKFHAGHEPALHHRIRRAHAGDESGTKRRVIKAHTSDEPAVRHRSRKAHAGKRRQAETEAPASRSWQLSQF